MVLAIVVASGGVVDSGCWVAVAVGFSAAGDVVTGVAVGVNGA